LTFSVDQVVEVAAGFNPNRVRMLGGVDRYSTIHDIACCYDDGSARVDKAKRDITPIAV
jgi:hypothetical protein